MAAVTTTYNETVETHLYWDLLKNLSDGVKEQLVMKLNQSLRGKTSTAEDAEVQACYYAILKKLNTYKSYPAGWDGEDASPLTSQVVENFNLLLDRIDKRLLKGLTIFPETNGTLLIESTRREAGISLGDKDFSYYEIEGDTVKGKDDLPFSVEAVIEVISRINR